MGAGKFAGICRRKKSSPYPTGYKLLIAFRMRNLPLASGINRLVTPK